VGGAGASAAAAAWRRGLAREDRWVVAVAGWSSGRVGARWGREAAAMAAVEAVVGPWRCRRGEVRQSAVRPAPIEPEQAVAMHEGRAEETEQVRPAASRE